MTGEQVPLTFGHEFTGVVEELGAGVQKLKKGDRVCVQPILFDGTCAACKDGAINCCSQNGFIGFSGPGAFPHTLSEVATRRKEYAKQFGADYVLDPTKDDIVARCRELCDGVGVDLAFDCAGVQAGLNQAILATRAKGTIVNIAVWEKPASVQVNDLVFRERKYMGIATYVDGDFQEVLDALEDGRLQPEGMITKKVKLKDAVEEGFNALIKDKSNLVKILIEISP